MYKQGLLVETASRGRLGCHRSAWTLEPYTTTEFRRRRFMSHTQMARGAASLHVASHLPSELHASSPVRTTSFVNEVEAERRRIAADHVPTHSSPDADTDMYRPSCYCCTSYASCSWCFCQLNITSPTACMRPASLKALLSNRAYRRQGACWHCLEHSWPLAASPAGSPPEILGPP